MNGIFDNENGIICKINKVIDYCCLVMLRILFSLPIVTFGASTAAFHYTFHKTIRKDEGHIWRSFWKSFKSNFKQATFIMLIQIIVLAILIVNGYCIYYLYIATAITKIMAWIFFVVTLLLFWWMTFWLPYIAYFEDKIKAVVKNCGIIMLKNFRWSVLLLMLLAITVVLVSVLRMSLVMVWICYMTISGFIFERIFRKYIP